jgi:L-alanine-DL-glutamate epimerase-like enolase superfamily enzyme
VDILVDLNFNHKTEGYLKVARAMEPFDLFWVEMDMRHPAALRYIRSRTSIPVATGESLFGRREYRPFFEQGSMDSVIIDVPWKAWRSRSRSRPWPTRTRSMSPRTTSTVRWRR